MAEETEQFGSDDGPEDTAGGMAGDMVRLRLGLRLRLRLRVRVRARLG